MRTELKKMDERRLLFTGKFERFGQKTNWNGFIEKTVLLQDVINSSGRIVADHIWFNYTKGFQSLGELNPGDLIEFEARVKQYIKGYVNHREYIDERTVDYKLSHPTKFRKVSLNAKQHISQDIYSSRS